ncbi:hypothetical protein [Aminobacter sp. MDW-2]|uniref:hypothetical protein n=1 Tax=Aminobacter sp. MDW-2 TaxID=2666139 RepID=UPI0013124302|nr:hypothetical protein [Aminobacter sp. MDW-2]MRX33233.1 hypothetical protein [Aminobacter sp. MDW-2]QNH36852.1 hypothetical protein H5P29_13680 [Aminobacter sp. MDW-2]
MTRETIGERQVRVEEQLKAVEKALVVLAQQGVEAAEGRRRGYEAAEATRLDVHDLKRRLDSLEKAVDAIKPTTTEYAQVRDRVAFAGTLGKALWAVGKQVLAAAAGAAAAWYAITGRPPP